MTLLEGDWGYVSLPRRPLTGVLLTLLKAQKVPSTDDGIALFIRKDNRVYFREGQVIADGGSLELFGPDPVTPLGTEPITFPAAAYGIATGLDLPYKVMGQFPFDASEYETGRSFALETLLSVTVGTLTGTVTLHNLTDNDPVTLTGASTTSALVPTRLAPTMTVGGAAGNLRTALTVYEVRVATTGGVPAITEKTFHGGSVIRMGAI